MKLKVWSGLSGRAGKERDPDVSPLIDMVFILLIFFIVTTVFVDEVGLEILSPRQSIDPSPNPGESFCLKLGANGEIHYRNQSYALGEIPQLVREHPKTPVMVEVHKDALSGWMVQLVDAARIGGAETISVTKER